MAFANPSASRPQGPRPPRPAGGGARRRRNPLVITALVLLVIVFAVVLMAQFWTEVMWFDQLGFATVLWTEWGTRAVLFASCSGTATAPQWPRWTSTAPPPRSTAAP